MTLNVLIVDDDLRMRQLIGTVLGNEGFGTRLAANGKEALPLIQTGKFDLLITDLKMPHFDGMSLLEIARTENPEIVVIVITGYGTVDSAIEAMKKGAYDYLQKPFEPDECLIAVRRAAEHIRLTRENRRLKSAVMLFTNEELIGASHVLEKVKTIVSKIAPFDTTVLIEGETGTGKELIARLIHQGSARRENTFLPINCGALSASLLEAELFGYEQGAFTGATRRKAGVFEAAHRGTIFLDEIGTIGLPFQVKLLRILQEGRFLRVGGAEEVGVDVRIIAATNESLPELTAQGLFRKDLLYRLNVVSIRIPSLRERKEDIPSLAYHFLSKFASKYGKKLIGISDIVLRKLIAYDWPGNVRELENVIERSVIMEQHDELQDVHLETLPHASLATLHECSGLMTLQEMEKHLILRTLASVSGKKAEAARILGISTTSLWRKLRSFNIC